MKSLPALTLIGASFLGTFIYGNKLSDAADINAQGLQPIKTEGYHIPDASFANARITQVPLDYDPAHPERVVVWDPANPSNALRLRPTLGCQATTPEGSVTVLKPDIGLVECSTYREAIRKGYSSK